METTYNIAIPDSITHVYSIFHLVGLWRNKDGVAIYQVFFFVYFMMLIVSITVGSFITEDPDERVFQFVTTFIGIVQITRMHCLIWKEKKIKSLTRENGIYSTNDYEVYTRAVKKMNSMNTLARLFMSVMVLCLIAVALFPLVSNEKRLIYTIPFPVDYTVSTGAFWMAYTFVTTSFFWSIVCCFYVVVVWYMMLNFTIKYEVPGSQFKYLGMAEAKERKVGRNNLSTTGNSGLYLKN